VRIDEDAKTRHALLSSHGGAMESIDSPRVRSSAPPRTGVDMNRSPQPVPRKRAGDRLTNADVTSNVRQSIEYIHIDAPCVRAELRFATTAS
jgi:hypothetical protein